MMENASQNLHVSFPLPLINQAVNAETSYHFIISKIKNLKML